MACDKLWITSKAVAAVDWHTMSQQHASTEASPTRRIAQIAVPVSLEFVFILVLNFANQIVVANLGDTAIAAVGFANSINFIFTMTLSAIGASVAILVARAFGARKTHDVNAIVTLAAISSVVLSMVALTPIALFPAELLQLTGAPETVVASGSSFLAISMLSLPFAVLAAALSGALRSAGHARSPMVATLVTVGFNVPLALALVFGLGPIPALGIDGAAWATLITSVAKAAVLWVQTFPVYRVARWELPRDGEQFRHLWLPLMTLAAPIALQTTFWTTGNFLYNIVVAQLGDEALAATNILVALENVFIVASLGLISAITALVGRAIGAGEGDLAEDWVRRIRRIGFASGTVFGILFAATAFAVTSMFPTITPLVITYTITGIIANAVMQPIKVQNGLHGGGILPSAGDIKGVLITDFTSPFVVGLPLAIATVAFTDWGFYGIIGARLVEEVAKYTLFRWRARTVNWRALARTPTVEMSAITDDDPQPLLGQA